jgi:hypothetical protein
VPKISLSEFSLNLWVSKPTPFSSESA